MFLPALLALSALWVGFEIGLAVLRRADERASRKDAGSLGVLNLAIYGSVGVGMYLSASGRGYVAMPGVLRWAGLGVILLGLGLRIWAVVTLRRYFTVDVAIHRGHQLVRSGPYRWVRHPAYAGSLLSFAGLAVCSSSWLAALVILVPIGAAFFYRIRIEEAALCSAFPAEYPGYCSGTARLLPGVF